VSFGRNVPGRKRHFERAQFATCGELSSLAGLVFRNRVSADVVSVSILLGEPPSDRAVRRARLESGRPRQRPMTA